MSRALALQFGIAAVALAGGATVLARPGVVRAHGGEPRYLARIAGTMLVAAGVFLGGFAAVFQWASAT